MRCSVHKVYQYSHPKNHSWMRRNSRIVITTKILLLPNKPSIQLKVWCKIKCSKKRWKNLNLSYSKKKKIYKWKFILSRIFKIVLKVKRNISKWTLRMLKRNVMSWGKWFQAKMNTFRNYKKDMKKWCILYQLKFHLHTLKIQLLPLIRPLHSKQEVNHRTKVKAKWKINYTL